MYALSDTQKNTAPTQFSWNKVLIYIYTLPFKSLGSLFIIIIIIFFF